MKWDLLEYIDKIGQRIKDIMEAIIKKIIWTSSPLTPEVVHPTNHIS